MSFALAAPILLQSVGQMLLAGKCSLEIKDIAARFHSPVCSHMTPSVDFVNDSDVFYRESSQ